MGLTAAAAGRAGPSNARLNGALLLSLLAHGLLLSLTFGTGHGLAGLDLPWSNWDVAPELRVALRSEPVPAGASPPSPAPAPAPTPKSDAPASVEAATVPAPLRADEPVTRKLMSGESAPEAPLTPFSPPPVLMAERPAVAAWAVAAASAVPTAAVATLSAASSPAVEALRRPGDTLRTRDDREARERAAALAQLDAPSEDAQAVPTTAVAAFASASSPALEPLRRSADALRTAADRDRATELARLDTARQESQQRAQRLEAARQEAQRAEVARAEADRQQMAREAAARQAAARLEAARQEAARAEAGRQEAARLEIGRIESARLAQVQAQAEAEQREARLRAIGRQLDEERAKRDADRQRPDWVPARRGRLYARTDANEALTQYGELWGRKLELNQTFEMVREAARQPHTDPVVTVAVRSDGSVESVTFLRSSGVPALDDAIRRVVLSQERYPAFSPALLRDYDVVEIRRSWHFDSAIRLY